MRRHRIVACLSVAVLAVVAGVMPATASTSRTVAALRWTSYPDLPPARGGFGDVSCVSREFCIAGDLHGRAFEWNGNRWLSARVDPTGAITHLSCASTTLCAATVQYSDPEGHGLGYRPAVFNGKHWLTSPSRTLNGRALSVECARPQMCMLLSADVEGIGSNFDAYQVWDGSQWSPPAGLPEPYSQDESEQPNLECPSATKCFAIDNNNPLPHPRIARWDGSVWSVTDHRSPKHFLVAGMACGSASSCLTVSTDWQSLVWRNGKWSDPVGHIGTLRTAQGAQCASPSFCVAWDATGGVRAFRGGVWHARQRTGVSHLAAVSCVDRRFCMAVGGAGNVVIGDRGRWSEPTQPDPLFGVRSDVSCASKRFCAVVDSGGGSQTFDSTSWTAPVRMPHRLDAVTVSCPSRPFCVASGAYGSAVRERGKWSAHGPAGASAGADLSCASESLCLLADGDVYLFDGNLSTDLGNPDIGRVTDVSCAPGTTTCMIVDSEGQYLQYVDGALTTPAPIGSNVDGATSVSCSSPTFCAAASNSGELVTWNGDTWSSPTQPDQARRLGAVACTSRTFCVAVGRNDSTTFDGTTWSVAAPISSLSNADNLNSVSCTGNATEHLCIALDSRTGDVAAAH